MNSDKRYFLLGIFVTVVFGIFVNILTPYFLSNQLSWLILFLASIVFFISIYRQEIRSWLAKKSLINQKKQVEELKLEIESFDKIRLTTRTNQNKFILLVIKKYVVWLLALFFLLFSRVSIKSIMDVLSGSPNANFFDFYALGEFSLSLFLIVNFYAMARSGWEYLENLADDSKGNEYRENIIAEIHWLETRVSEKEKRDLRKEISEE